jgi:amidase
MEANNLAYAGAAEQSKMIASGAATAREVVEATLARIDRVNPVINAYRVVFADQALAEADRIDAAGAGDGSQPMRGVPVSIKDDTDVLGERTAWGSLATSTNPAPHDGDVVARLREAGAIIVGKTNVPELTVWPFTETLAFGATRNPWNIDYTTGGSSGGAGAAAAAGLCGVAHGSDGAGSVRIPAAFNGLFGLKTQRERISLGPNHFDGWNGMTVYGPLARTVADAALFLDATADGGPEGGYLAALDISPTPLRIAISLKPPPGSITKLGAEQRAAIDSTAAALRELGHEVFEQEIDYPIAAFVSTVARYLRSVTDDAGALQHPERLEQRTKNMARLGGLISDRRLAQARAAEPGVAAQVNTIFEDADAVLMPGTAAAPFKIGQLQGRGALWTLNAAASRVPWYGVWNAIGQPASSVPAGFDSHGLPLSVQFGAAPGDELTLLRIAAQLEQVRPWAQARPPLDGSAQ